MTYTPDDMDELKAMLEETDESERALSDERLETLLSQAETLREAAYKGALFKAYNDGITLPDGMSTGSNRSYWLTVAAAYRTNHTGCVPRADDIDVQG